MARQDSSNASRLVKGLVICLVFSLIAWAVVAAGVFELL